MPTTTSPLTGCPSGEALRGLIAGRLTDGEQSALTGHLDGCPGCQAQLERLAEDGDPLLSRCVRGIDCVEPPKDSAYWKALNQAEMAMTQDLGGDDSGRPVGDLKLDFLRPSDKPGRIGKLGRFEVARVIGRGGMGVVLNALDPDLARDVAVKILDPQLLNNETARQRFCREARSAASVSHDNIVAVHQVDIDEASGLPFIVMQLVNGETLEQRLRRVGRLPIADAVRIGAQAAAGLASAHASSLIHRDIKPGNILLESGTDKVKLTDFGLARAAEDLKLTRTGLVAGTPLYMAPEQARGEEVDARADLFSLGSVLYESLAGNPPFGGTTPLAVLRRIADDNHPPLSKVNPDVPDWLEDIIDRLLEKKPEKRFQTAAEVAEVLTAHVPCAEAPADSDPACVISTASKIFRRRRRRPLAVAGLLVAPFLAGGLLGGVVGWELAPREQKVVATAGDGPPSALPVAAPGPVAAAPGPVGPNEIGLMRGTGGGVLAVAASGDGTTAALGLESGEITLWDVNPVKRRAGLSKHTGAVWAVEFFDGGKKLVSAGDDGKVLVWDLTVPKVIRSFTLSSAIRAAAVSPNMAWVAAGGRDGTVTVLDLSDDSGVPVRQFKHAAAVNAVAFAPDGLAVASAGADGLAVVWDIPPAPDGRKRLTLRGHTGPVYGAAFSPDGEWLATSGWDRSVTLWDMTDGSVVKKLTDAHESGVRGVEFSCCGKILATAGDEGVAKVWDVEAAKPTPFAVFARHKGAVQTARFAGDGGTLITGGRDGAARVWASAHKVAGHK